MNHMIQAIIHVVCTNKAPLVGCGLVILICPAVGPLKRVELRQAFSLS